MSVTMTTITGPVYLPNGMTPLGGRVSFELSSWDLEDASGLIVTGPVYADIDSNGQFSIDLFTSSAGENSVTYRMFVIWEDSTLAQSYVNDIYVSHPEPHYTKKYIGSFALSGPGPFQLSELNIVSELNNSSFDVYLEMKEFVDRIDLGALDTAVATSQTSAATATTQATNATASASSASTNAIATAADRVQTGLDVVATAADRVQTGLDKTATELAVVQATAVRFDTDTAFIAADLSALPAGATASPPSGLQIKVTDATGYLKNGWEPFRKFATVADMLASRQTAAVGDIFMVAGLRYDVVTTSEHLTTAGPVKLKVADEIATPAHLDMDVTGATDERANLIKLMQHNAPAPVLLPKGAIIGLSENLKPYDRTVFPVQPGGFICDTTSIMEEAEFTGDGTTTEFVVPFSLYQTEVFVNGFNQTKKVQPFFTSLILEDLVKDNDFQLYRPTRTVKFTHAPYTGDVIRVTSKRPGAMLKAIGDWASLASNAQKNAMIAFAFNLTNPATVSGFTLQNVGIDCNGRARGGMRGATSNPNFKNIYITGERSYGFQCETLGGVIEDMYIDHCFPVLAGETDVGVTAGEDVIVPAKRPFVSGAQNTDDGATLYVSDFFTSQVDAGSGNFTVSRDNNGYDSKPIGTILRNTTVHMNGCDYQAGFWCNNARNGSSSYDLKVVDGPVGLEQADMTFINPHASMSGMIGENRLKSPTDFISSDWLKVGITPSVSSETAPSEYGTAQLLTTTGASSFPRIEQDVSLEVSDSFWSIVFKPGTGMTRALIEISGSEINQNDSEDISRYEYTVSTGAITNHDGDANCHVRCDPVGNGFFRFSILAERSTLVDKVVFRPAYNTSDIIECHVVAPQLAKRSQSYQSVSTELDGRMSAYLGKREQSRMILVNPIIEDNGREGTVGIAVTTDTDVTVTGGRTTCDIALRAHPDGRFTITGHDIRASGQQITSTTPGMFNTNSVANACPGLDRDLSKIISGSTHYEVENFVDATFVTSQTHTVQFNGTDLEVQPFEMYEVIVVKDSQTVPQHLAKVRGDSSGDATVITIAGGSSDITISGSGSNIVVTNTGSSAYCQIVTHRVS